MAKTMQRAILVLVFGLAASAFTFAQDNWRDINRDRRDIYRDRVDLRHDYAKLRRDEMNHNWRAVQRDRADIYRDRADLRGDYADIREDYREYYRGGWRDRCVDPDHDGDCDFVRHRHHRHQNGWYGNPYGYSNPGIWGNYPYAGGWNSGWENGRAANSNVPPGWRHGRKRGWGNSNLPPGQAKKSGWWYR